MGRHSLTPFALACKATRLMDTDRGTATRARPLGQFAFGKSLYPGNANGLKVLDHAHPVFCPVTFIKMCQQFARKAGTVAAVTRLASGPTRAVLNPASDPGFGLAAVVAPATGAGIPGPHVCKTQPAIHPTGRDQCDLIVDSSRRFGCIFALCRHERSLADSRPLFNRLERWLVLLQVFFCRVNVSAKGPVLLSLFNIGHLAELGLFPKLQVVFILLLTDFAGTDGFKHSTAWLACMAAIPITAVG